VSISAKIAVLVDAVKKDGFEGIPPAERRRLAAVFRWFAVEVDPDKKIVPMSGVLRDLKMRQAHE
jgi:hypothetical protein